MSYEIRVTQPDEWRTAADTFRGALMSAPSTDADWEKEDLVGSWSSSHSLSAWDGAQCLGHAGAFHFLTVVPGGSVLPTAGVTRVGVRQTHTRQGILTGMMTQLLRDSVEQGKVLASLRASEAVIYGRFGYAIAGEAWDVEIDVQRGVRVVAPTAPGSIRILAPGDILETVEAIHDRVGLDRPGAVARDRWMHQRYMAAALSGEKAAYVIVHTGVDGVDDGWAQYELEWPEGFGQPAGGICTVEDVWAASPAVELALWKFILGLDLVDRVRAHERPTDDAVRFALNDVRYYLSVARMDEQWLRLLDVDAALQTRTYNPASSTVTISVTDPLFAANTGTWRVTADGASRIADTARDDADLSTTINGISAAYLGGTAWWDVLVAGKVEERRSGAIREADTLFASHPLPRCGSFF